MNTSTSHALRDYQAQERAALATEPAVRAELLALGIDTVWADYDGVGDQGQIENVAYFNSQQPGQVFGVDEALQGRVDALLNALLDLRHPGWENGDGASGSFAMDVAAGTLEHEHRERYTEVRISSHEGFGVDGDADSPDAESGDVP